MNGAWLEATITASTPEEMNSATAASNPTESSAANDLYIVEPVKPSLALAQAISVSIPCLIEVPSSEVV